MGGLGCCRTHRPRYFPLLLALILLAAGGEAFAQCQRTVKADVVALDQVFFWNRLGTVQPQGMMFALKRDVVPINPALGLTAGNVQLRSDKRPRPMVLRMNVGDCLQITFTNLLDPVIRDNEQAATRSASVRVLGLQLVGSIASDGSNVGQNASSLVSPGGTAQYTFYAEHEGGYVLYSAGATTGGEGDGGQLNAGLFGAVDVEVGPAEWYRSQVTADDLAKATVGHTADGHPILNYNATYADGTPILKMLDADNNIVHTDLTAVITGPNHGRFPAGTYRPNATEPDRDQPFREFTLIYHDEIGAIDAFPIFYDPQMKYTLHSVRDGFAINYGTGGVGAEIVANRIGVGPMWNCTECKFEEFFLTSWAVGDPAMVVDVPANAPCTPSTIKSGSCAPVAGPKATKALYADDPSNVYHSYINDHVKMRIMHGGSKEHHIHHLHAHQWLATPDSDNSAYLDSQALGPGATYTLEIVHGGGGNRNGVVGDSIFHCHFYPHFAQGMWSLWRTHDVFESGTPLDATGTPIGRALPDGEIAAGTPIPALVPMPTLVMAPLPEADVTIVNGQAVVSGTGNPGYPFFIAANAGHRPTHPPLDTDFDGGLPRHLITGGTFTEQHTRLDFSKELLAVQAQFVPEDGTDLEKRAMAYHAIRFHPSFTPDGTAGQFKLNGLPAAPGAPYADPCVDDNGNPTGKARIYKAAVVQTDAKLNKAGWHFPQQRFEVLWGDVAATLNGTKPPEPFFFRANTGDCITFYHTVLAKSVYEQDDFQVRTPTDVMGQHIHLVKFDVTSSDGSGNGFNYEDGTFAPGEVIERINAINAGMGAGLVAKPHPYLGVVGAQTTIQRWYADDVLNNNGADRTLRTVFTHDHYGPSSHQQAGLYSGLVVEPAGSTWRNPVTGEIMGSRFDGGPTSWNVDLLAANPADSYREFMLEIADFQPAYYAGAGGTADNPHPDPAGAVNPPARIEVALPINTARPVVCPGSGAPPPCPEAISADDTGMRVANYRNEPIPLRVRDPLTNAQAAGLAGDLAFALSSNVTRADAVMNAQPAFYPPLTPGVQGTDPFTPLLRVYEGDRVQIRTLVGATEELHNFTLHGVKWLYEPSDPNSGYRNSQPNGISEHFEFLAQTNAVKGTTPWSDFLYTGGSVNDIWDGMWGLMRVYNGGVGLRSDLLTLPNNPGGKTPSNDGGLFAGVCPKAAPSRKISITAVAAQTAIPGGTLVYNSGAGSRTTKLHDPTAILYVRSTDLDANNQLKAGVPIEPLVVRANSGDCIDVTLTNALPATLTDLPGWDTGTLLIDNFNLNQVAPSTQVGINAGLVEYDMTSSDGANVGANQNTSTNPVLTAQTVGPGGVIKYKWYAGRISYPNGVKTATAVEFGAVNLTSADPIKHGSKGAIGALIVEPAGATWVEDATSRAQATVTAPNGAFREFVLVFQSDVNLRRSDGSAIPNLAKEEDAEDSGQKAFNYRTEPFWNRMGFAPDAPLEVTRTFDFKNVLSNGQVGGDPETPVFTATRGTPVRFRVLFPAGNQRDNIFTIHGHGFQDEPYTNGSTVQGFNPLSEYFSARMGVGPSDRFNVLLNSAGGVFNIPGDYLYRTFQSFQFDGGLWGIFRVK